jgi:hypothetical protein
MKISQLMSKIRSIDLVLPEFQREYVWNYDQAKELLISLYRGFPTGSLLFWETTTPPAIKNATIDPDKIGSSLVILDGQQRLTTLYLFTQNKIPPYYTENDIKYDPRDLYFNLENGDFRYYQVTRMKNNPAWVAVTDCFSDQDLNLFKIAQEQADDDAEAFQIANQYNKHLNQLQNIVSRAYPIQTVPSSATIDDAIDVFDLVNSQGTPLTKAELALAHITGKWPEAREVMKTKIKELSNKHYHFDLTFMTRALTGVVHERALFETIHETKAEPIKKGWKLLNTILDYLINVLAGHANIHSTEDLNTTNVLVPVIVHLARHDVSFENDQNMRQFIHWMYAANTWRRYTSQTDQRLDHDLSIIKRNDSPWSSLIEAIIDQRGRIRVKPSDLEGRTARHPLYRMTYVLAKSQGAIDWFNGMPLNVPPDDSSYKIHSHHIFPSSLLYSEEGGYNSENHLDKKLVNEIANRAFLTGKSNISLGNKKPSVYLAEVAQKYPGALEKQFVPTNPELWKLDRYEDFLEARRILIAEAINERMDELITTLQLGKTQAVEDMLTGENAALEYKSSMRWDMRREQVNKDLEKVIAKSVAGFLNSEGGTLLIGVADDCTILGLDYDLQTLGRRDLDGYEQTLQQVLSNSLGVEYSQYWDVDFEEVNGEYVCVVRVDPSPEPVYLKYKGEKEFYVRVGNTTRPLDMQAAHEYIGMHWTV